MLSRLVGARHSFGPDDIEGQLKSKLVSSFSDSIAELKIAVLDLQAQYDEISEFMAQKQNIALAHLFTFYRAPLYLACHPSVSEALLARLQTQLDALHSDMQEDSQ
mgnify:CR=1 FL=1